MPSNSAAQSRPANFAKTETHIFTIRCHDDFLYFFFKNKLLHLPACQRELLKLQELIRSIASKYTSLGRKNQLLFWGGFSAMFVSIARVFRRNHGLCQFLWNWLENPRTEAAGLFSQLGCGSLCACG
jgi:hypothetical protein